MAPQRALFFSDRSLDDVLEAALVHLSSALADFCTLLFLGRMLFAAKELEEDGISNIGMVFFSFQSSFCSGIMSLSRLPI